MPPHQVLARAGNHMADIDGLAGFGIGHQAVLARLMLEVEDRGQRLRGAGERGMRRESRFPTVKTCLDMARS